MSFAGFKVSAGLQVMSDEGSVIPNLYAIGEVIGAGATSGAAYTNGMLVTPAITFGRLLGTRLANTARYADTSSANPLSYAPTH
jgi:succinate dehydrogenase/fumarate reductase flavoprotein subunit